nr:hypothetical protein [Nanoarchaeum sp.]
MKSTIKDGRTELTTSSGLTFAYPGYYGNYAGCQRKIRQAGEQTPTYAQLVDIVYEAVVKDPTNQYSQEIKKIMKQDWLWGSTSSLFVPSGVYVQDRPILGSDGLPIMKESELEAKLQAGDPSVRFVELNFEKVFDLVNNPYIIALAGEHGVEQLAEIASSYKSPTFVYSLENVIKPIARVSALTVGNWVFGDGLGIVGDFHGFNGGGRAFGVRES